MKQLFFLLMFILVMRPLLQAQNFNNEFGKVGKDDVDLAFYSQDKSAEAVVISDVGSSYFQDAHDSFDLIYERTTRLKVLKEAGIKWASIEIPYYQQGDIYEEVYDLEACTYNFEKGLFTRTNLDLKNCHEEKLNQFWNLKKFAMPNVKEGSIIEYRYKVRSQFFFNLRNWEFQWKIPVIYSKYIVKMIPFYQYTSLLQGAGKIDSQKSYLDEGGDRQFAGIKYQDKDYEYVMKNVPAFKDEEFITSENDYIMKIDFQLSKITDQYGASHNIMTTWPEMVKDFVKDEDFGGYSRKSESLASKIFDLKSFSSLPTQQKFDSILNYVKSNYSWNKRYGNQASKSPKVFMKDKLGNDADLNLFTVGLLNAAGVKAWPVILSTRKNGKIKTDYPFEHYFNYVVILADIDGKNVLSDATLPLLANYRIPEKCINDKGLIIQKDKVEWLGLQSLLPSKTQEIINITLSDSTQNSAVKTVATEYLAFDCRNDFGSDAKTIKKYLLDKGYSVVDSSIVVTNQTDIKKPYILKYSITDRPEKVNNKIYVSPFLREVMTESPLKQATRTYPIDMTYPKSRVYYTEINIPEGYKVDFMPANDKINNDQFELEYIANVSENKIVVSLNYYFKIPVYNSDDYNKIKYYFNEIVNKGSEKVVFVKK